MVHLVGFTVKYIMIHGPMNVKYIKSTCWVFEPCYIAAHELYFVRFIYLFFLGGDSIKRHKAHQIQRLCVLCTFVLFTGILILFLRQLYGVKNEHLMCTIDYCKIQTKMLPTYRQHFEMHFHVHFLWNSHIILNTEGVKNVSKKPLKKNETCAVSSSFYRRVLNFLW
jgi:hypothetical protein